MEDIISANEEMNQWCDTQGINYYEGDTALGFLFKYAVPKLNLKQKWYVLFSFIKDYCNEDKDPALALFWALDKVRQTK